MRGYSYPSGIIISIKLGQCFITYSSMVRNVLLKQIDDWRDISLPKELVKRPRLRMLGANSTVTGFGNEYKMLNINDTNPHPR